MKNIIVTIKDTEISISDNKENAQLKNILAEQQQLKGSLFSLPKISSTIKNKKEQIQGTLTLKGSLNGSLNKKIETKGVLAESHTYTGEVKIPYSKNYNIYQGPTEIIPTFSVQMLETEGKVLNNNITVLEIPVYQVSNEYGITVTI